VTPIIYSREESGIRLNVHSHLFGNLGEIEHLTWHHSAGARAPTKAEAQRLHRLYQDMHIAKGWGDIGYHLAMDDLGRFYRLRPLSAKGAHVGRWNSRNVGIMVHGNYEFHNLTEAQRLAIEWVYKGGLYVLLNEPEAGIESTPVHNEWSGHESNACAGDNLIRHVRWRRGVDLH
jgi:hypothetical protein